jgi:hypothetical protein
MTAPDDPDEIDRALAELMTGYHGPPTARDLQELDASVIALGLSFGFDDAQPALVVANNRRHLANAREHWADRHPNDEFLQHSIGAGELARAHRLILKRAHADCTYCTERVWQLQAADSTDQLDPVDLELWLLLEPVGASRSGDEDSSSDASKLVWPSDGSDPTVEAERFDLDEWQITVSDPTARSATLLIEWSGKQVTQVPALFENRTAFVYVTAPASGAYPRRVRIAVNPPSQG